MRNRLIRSLSLLAVALAVAACAAPSLAPSTADQAAPLIAATPSPSVIDAHHKAMRPGFEKDVDAHAGGLHYWLDLTVQAKPVGVSGHERVHYVNTTGSALKDVVLRLYANGLSSQQLQAVSHVTVDGKSAQTELTGNKTVLQVLLGSELAPGQSAQIELDFSLELPDDYEFSYGRISDKGGLIALSSFVPLVSVYERGQWSHDLPVPQGDPAFSQVALFDVQLSAPSTMKVAATGVVVSQTPGQNGATSYQIVTGPVRDFSVALSPDFELLTAVQDGVTVNIWSAPGDKAADQAGLEKTLTALKIFDQQFGKYPFSEFDVVEAPITALGIEYPGLIYIAFNAWGVTRNYLFDFVLSHEIAHQWWYSMVGDDQINEPWVDEALADYSVIVYFREAYNEDAAKNVRNFYQADVDQYLAAHNNARLPTGLPVSAYDANQYGTFVYNAGALFYSHLEDDYGSDKVIQMLRAYYQRHRYGVAHIDDVRRIVSEFFGDKAAKFFDQWVKGG